MRDVHRNLSSRPLGCDHGHHNLLAHDAARPPGGTSPPGRMPVGLHNKTTAGATRMGGRELEEDFPFDSSRNQSTAYLFLYSNFLRIMVWPRLYKKFLGNSNEKSV
jgi:hypothetical protein